MAKGKGGGAAAPAAPAPAAPAAAPAPPSINVKSPGPAMVGDKTASQVKSETDVAIAEAIAEAKAEDDGVGSGSDADSKSAEGGSTPPDAAESDDEDEDEPKADDDADDDQEDGPKLSRRALKKREKQLTKRETTIAAREQQTEKDAQLLEKLFGKSYAARQAAKAGDVEATRAALEATLQEWTGMDLDDAMIFLVDPTKAKTPEQRQIDKLTREREAERREVAAAKQKEQRAAEEAKAITWIKAELAGQPLAKLPGFERIVLQTMIQRYNDGAKTPRKAAKMALEGLRQNYDALRAVFGEGAPAPAAEPTTPRPRVPRGSPPREGAAGRASQDARPQTTGDLIAEVMLEEKFWKPGDKRVEGLRGKRVGAGG
jgi:hypothetical protein